MSCWAVAAASGVGAACGCLSGGFSGLCCGGWFVAAPRLLSEGLFMLSPFVWPSLCCCCSVGGSSGGVGLVVLELATGPDATLAWLAASSWAATGVVALDGLCCGALC